MQVVAERLTSQPWAALPKCRMCVTAARVAEVGRSPMACTRGVGDVSLAAEGREETHCERLNASGGGVARPGLASAARLHALPSTRAARCLQGRLGRFSE